MRKLSNLSERFVQHFSTLTPERRQQVLSELSVKLFTTPARSNGQAKEGRILQFRKGDSHEYK